MEKGWQKGNKREWVLGFLPYREWHGQSTYLCVLCFGSARDAKLIERRSFRVWGLYWVSEFQGCPSLSGGTAQWLRVPGANLQVLEPGPTSAYCVSSLVWMQLGKVVSYKQGHPRHPCQCQVFKHDRKLFLPSVLLLSAQQGGKQQNRMVPWELHHGFCVRKALTQHPTSAMTYQKGGCCFSGGPY